MTGGVLLAAVVLLTVFSTAGNVFFDRPFSGDFEVVEITVAIAVFMFLPYCQFTDAHVCADVFTARLGVRALARLRMLSSFVAAACAGVLLWRMSAGMSDYHADGAITHILAFPLWLAFPPILVSLFLWLLAAAFAVCENSVRLINLSLPAE